MESDVHLSCLAWAKTTLDGTFDLGEPNTAEAGGAFVFNMLLCMLLCCYAGLSGLSEGKIRIGEHEDYIGSSVNMNTSS